MPLTELAIKSAKPARVERRFLTAVVSISRSVQRAPRPSNLPIGSQENRKQLPVTVTPRCVL